MPMKIYIQYNPVNGGIVNIVKADPEKVGSNIKDAPNTVVVDEGPYIAPEVHFINPVTLQVEQKPLEKSDLRKLVEEFDSDPVAFFKLAKESPTDFATKINAVKLSAAEQAEYTSKVIVNSLTDVK